MSITTQIITKNNQATIKKTLESLLPLGGKIIIADIGSADETVNVCRKYKADVFKFKFANDFSKTRNALTNKSETEWNFYLHPWEILVSGHEEILAARNAPSYHLKVIENKIIKKETRLWKNSSGLRFENPVYETIYGEFAELNGVIYVGKSKQDYELKAKIIEEWKSASPSSTKPYYYQAFNLLAQNKYKEFISAAGYYLFNQKKGRAAVMMNYYCAMVNLYEFKNVEKAIKHILFCIAERPMMSEFWCLLGDAYYRIKKYKKAKDFYNNALIIGNRRLVDNWPMDVNKYIDYPSQMIESCSDILKNSNYYTTGKFSE